GTQFQWTYLFEDSPPAKVEPTGNCGPEGRLGAALRGEHCPECPYEHPIDGPRGPYLLGVFPGGGEHFQDPADRLQLQGELSGPSGCTGLWGHRQLWI